MGSNRTVFAAFAFAGLAVVADAVRPCPAMTGDDLTGAPWNVSYRSRLRLPGLARDGDSTAGTLTFGTDGTFVAYEDDHGVDRNFPGTWTLSSDGRKLRWSLDAAGKAEVRDVVADWLRELAAEDGLPLKRLVVRLPRITGQRAKVPAVAGPFTAKLTATGHIAATIGRERIVSTVSYSATLDVSR